MCNITAYHSSQGAPSNVSSMIAVTIFVVLLAAVGIFGNVVTIMVIARSKKLKTVFNMLIISLCCSDLVSAITSFIRAYCFTWDSCAYEGRDNKAHHTACNIGWRITNWMTFNTAIHITSFAAMRFISIKWPARWREFTLQRVRIFIVASWAVTFVCGFVVVFIRKNRRIRLVSYSVTYIALSTVMTALSVCVAAMIYNRRYRRKSMRGLRDDITDAERRRRSKESQQVVQLLLIVASFLLGYIPRAAYVLQAAYLPRKERYALASWSFSVIQYFSLRVSECLNPVFYNVGCRDLFKETKKMLKTCYNKTTCSNSSEQNEVISANPRRVTFSVGPS